MDGEVRESCVFRIKWDGVYPSAMPLITMPLTARDLTIH